MGKLLRSLRIPDAAMSDHLGKALSRAATNRLPPPISASGGGGFGVGATEQELFSTGEEIAFEDVADGASSSSPSSSMFRYGRVVRWLEVGLFEVEDSPSSTRRVPTARLRKLRVTAAAAAANRRDAVAPPSEPQQQHQQGGDGGDGEDGGGEGEASEAEAGGVAGTRKATEAEVL